MSAQDSETKGEEPSENQAPAEETPNVDKEPSGNGFSPEKKRNINLFIGAFLLVQMILPITYYFSDTPADERYAWRMFSSQRVVQCSTQWFEGSARTRFSPTKEVHVVWNTLMTRQRIDVVNAYAKRRCDQQRAQTNKPEVYFKMSCQEPGSSEFKSVYDGQPNLCEVDL